MIGAQFVQKIHDMTFEEIYADRKLLYDAIKLNKTGVLKILTELYSDSTHFIYEILQNAEDAGATKISFSLFPEKFVINHNGRSFELKDIAGITNIAEEDSDKINDQDKIGKFGIGFKSVYAITNMPQIQSGIYDFKIKELLLPELLSDKNNFIDTCIILPFYNNKITNEDIFELLRKKLGKLEYSNLLFLKNLKEIKIEIDNSSRLIYKEERSLSPKENNLAYECIINSDGLPHHYLHFKKEVKLASFASLENKPKLSIAFKQDLIEGVPYINKAESSKLFVFFETGYETFLKFMIHAPFITTPARDNVNFQDPTNIQLLKELIELFKDVLEYLSTNKLIDINILNHLPIDSSSNKNEIVYQSFFATLKEEFLSEKKYLPANDSSLLASRSKVGLIRGKELKQILASKNDLQKLFKIDYWINSDITIDKTPQLRNYLMKELSIKEYGPEDFAKVVTKEFFESKPNTWIRSFYGFLNKQQSLYATGRGKEVGILRKKPIIRLLNGKHTEPFDINGKPKVFLSSDKKKVTYDIVHPEVISTKPALEFIREKLGIKEPNYVDQIRQQIIPLYKADVKSKVKLEKHFEHMQFILDIYSKGSESVKSEIVEMISNNEIFIFYVFDLKTTTNYWGRASNCYIESDELKEYFRFTEKVYFLNDTVYSTVSLDILHNLAIKCGAKCHPRILELSPVLSDEKKKKLRISFYNSDEITWHHGETIHDYTLFGLNDLFQQNEISIKDSLLIWNVLLDFIQYDSDKVKLFSGKYWWYRNYDRYAYFSSHILIKLRNSAWVYNKESKKFRPFEITVSDLADFYTIDSNEAIILINKLIFKTEAEQEYLNQLPLDKRNELLEAAELIRLSKETGLDYKSILQQKLNDEKRLQYQEELDNAPDLNNVTPEEIEFSGFNNTEVNVSYDEPSSDEKNGENLISGNDEKGSDNIDDIDTQTKSYTDNQLPQDIKNKIGYRGERIVWKNLKMKWSKKCNLISELENELKFSCIDGDIYRLIHLNDKERKGYGCDILIEKNEEIFSYIEVKSSKNKGKEYYSVSGFQWALAYKIYNQSIGNNYWIYVVTDVLSNNPKITPIQNPIKKWKDGKLKANPVNIEF